MPVSAACPVCAVPVSVEMHSCSQCGTVLLDENEKTATRVDAMLGMKLGDYQVVSWLGMGGMGIVYEGIQPTIEKRVAIKVIRPEFAATEVQQLIDEARTVNAIGHRGVVDIFGSGKLPDGRQYLVMEYLNGQPLDAVVNAQAPMPSYEVVAILEEIVEVLSEVHAAGVVHRDLKPGNIFLVLPGPAKRIFTGFGNSCAVVGTNLYCWGANLYQQIGAPSASSTLPILTYPLEVSHMALGNTHTCAVLTDGGVVICWGDNADKALGTTVIMSGNTPPEFAQFPIGDARATMVTAGNGFSCAVLFDGGMRCWGRNDLGQLGSGAPTGNTAIPVPIDGGVSAAASGFNHTCAISGARVYCWGSNQQQQTFGRGDAGGSSIHQVFGP